jgi:hypothetical protein
MLVLTSPPNSPGKRVEAQVKYLPKILFRRVRGKLIFI